MKIIYHCYGGAHASVTAAAVHLGWLPTDRLPDNEELKAIPHFDMPIAEDHGRIRLMGEDESGREIYIVGRRNEAQVFENMARGLMDIYKQSEDEFRFFDVMPYINWKMVLGGFTSRRMGITWFGRPVILSGVKYSYWPIVGLVQRVKVVTAAGQKGIKN